MVADVDLDAADGVDGAAVWHTNANLVVKHVFVVIIIIVFVVVVAGACCIRDRCCT